MKGPFKAGYWKDFADRYGFDISQAPQITSMKRGHRYRVTKTFVDVDGDEHPEGEQWEFIMSMFDRQTDHVTFCLRSKTGEEWELVLHWADKPHADIISTFSDYVTETT